MTAPSALPDSGDPGNEFEKLKLAQHKPELLTEATWKHLNERYQLCGELGQGGQAVVFFVKERAEGHRKLAIKVYHENTDAARKLFDHECRVLASDHLPQDLIVGYVQCVSEPGLQPYLVLEHIEGQPIGKYVRSARSMSVGEKVDLWERLCRALYRLHLCHLVFGDLKSENVLVEQDGTGRHPSDAGKRHCLIRFRARATQGCGSQSCETRNGADGAAYAAEGNGHERRKDNGWF
jgi:serine/threonine protein kinase